MNPDAAPEPNPNYSYSIADGKGGRYYVSRVPDYEFANPKDYLLEIMLNSKYRLMQIVSKSQGIIEPKEQIKKILSRRALRESIEEYSLMLRRALPPNLLALLDTERKKEQERLTKGMVITPEELSAFIAQAGQDYGFTYSQYKSQHYQKGLDKNKLPNVIIKEDDGSITKVGESALSDGQLKNVIDHRKVLIGKFLDKGDYWHCFIYTYKSLDGTEDGDWGSHIHYMSSKWGVARADVVAGIQNGRYVSSGLPHIKFPYRDEQESVADPSLPKDADSVE